MMNKVVLIGRLTRDPELKFTSGSGVAVTTFTLAVDRNYVGQNGQREADFIPIICWRKLAETAANNLSKGRLVAVSGAIQTRNYVAQDGTKRYVTEIIADSVQFLERKDRAQGQGQMTPPPEKAPDENGGSGEDIGFTPVDGDDDIPF